MREAKPYYKKSHKTWYYNDNGKPVRLDVDKTKAREIWKKLRCRDRDCSSLIDNPTTLVADLVAEFLDWVERNKKPSTYEFYQQHCESFCQRYKTLRIMDLRNLHVTNWIDRCYASCGSSRRNGAITSLKRALNWCRQEGYIKENPIAHCKKPKPKTRGDAAYIAPEKFDAILKDVKKNCKRASGECF
ncbi:MAG TPA: hypothetical protein VJ828_10025, partial [Lacipirellulaceae bacterium]|nr:hypothetical protein [Lacipirellulaceae bacterium]